MKACFHSQQRILDRVPRLLWDDYTSNYEIAITVSVRIGGSPRFIYEQKMIKSP